MILSHPKIDFVTTDGATPMAAKNPFLLAQAEEHHEEAPAADAHAPADPHAPADAHAADSASHESHDAHAASADHGGDHHGKASDVYELPDEFPNIYTVVEKMLVKDKHHHEAQLKGPFAVHGPAWVNPAFAMFYGFMFLMIVRKIMRGASIENPSRAQVAIEALFKGLYDFFADILGSEANARKYVPYVGSLWLFIYLSNVCGVIPLLKAPTAHFWTTIGLGICTFFYVNYNGIKAGGLGHYIWHLCGSPENALGWGFAVLIFPLEVVGTFVKPISLALRLSGNIFGEDKLLAAFMGLGVLIVSLLFGTPTPLFGIPLHVPFLFLAMLTCAIQATVFSLLATVYIAMLLPHEHHDEHGHEGDAAHH